MKLLLVTGRPFYPLMLGGADRCSHQLLLALTRLQNVECRVLAANKYMTQDNTNLIPGPKDYDTLGVKALEIDDIGNIFVDCGYPVVMVENVISSLEPELSDFEPDVVWTQLDYAEPLLQELRKRGVPSLLYVWDTEPVDLEFIPEMAAAGVSIVCLTRFLETRLREACGVEATVIYPIFGNGIRGQPCRDGLITMVSINPVKGIETLRDVALAMPSQRFFVAESWPTSPEYQALVRAMKPANVELSPRIADTRLIYQQSKLHLVPSRWEESFGMIVLEAQSYGIPVIASSIGGIPEAVGDGGVLIQDFLSSDAWVNAICALLNNPARYIDLSKQAHQNVLRTDFSAQHNSQCMLEVLCRTADGRGRGGRLL